MNFLPTIFLLLHLVNYVSFFLRRNFANRTSIIALIFHCFHLLKWTILFYLLRYFFYLFDILIVFLIISRRLNIIFKFSLTDFLNCIKFFLGLSDLSIWRISILIFRYFLLLLFFWFLFKRTIVIKRSLAFFFLFCIMFSIKFFFFLCIDRLIKRCFNCVCNFTENLFYKFWVLTITFLKVYWFIWLFYLIVNGF